MMSSAEEEDRSDLVAKQPGSFARFLYNQNPFYLISGLLVIYGCQSLALSGGDLVQKSLTMTGGIAAYTLLMVLVCIGVVRLAKVWDDARSIFIVVAISLVALTTAFDQLCINETALAKGFGVTAMVLVVLATETLLWCCRLRLSFWYRAAFYVHFSILVVSPIVFGDAVAQRNNDLANWGAVLFSVAIGLGALLLIPAVAKGSASVRNNGTPWNWPLYPLSLFVVLAVLAGLRSHAIWMSFGFFGNNVRFEPFLMLPILAAVLVLVAETGRGLNNRSLQITSLVTAPLLVVLTLSNGGNTWLPIGIQIQNSVGSALVIGLLTVFAIYAWLSLRGVRHAFIGMPATLLIASFLPVPVALRSTGLEPWMLSGLACLILAFMVLGRWELEWLWAFLASGVVITIALVGRSQNAETAGIAGASIAAVASMLVLGACFKTPLAKFCRHLAAAAMVLSVSILLVVLLRDKANWPVLASGVMAAIATGYGVLIRRRGWFAVALIQAFAFCVLLGLQGQRAGSLKKINWPIVSGLACLGVGIAITTGKTGFYRRLADRPRPGLPDGFQPGL